MSRSWVTCVVRAVVWVVGPFAATGTASLAGESLQAVREVIHHPAGPSTRIEYRSTGTGQVVRIDVSRARPGQWLTPAIRLLRGASGLWMVEQSDHGRRPLYGTPDRHPVFAEQTAFDGQCLWRISAVREHLPAPSGQGIVAEQMPSLDLSMQRMDCVQISTPK